MTDAMYGVTHSRSLPVFQNHHPPCAALKDDGTCSDSADTDRNDLITREELRLLAEWPVHELIDLLNHPRQGVDLHTDDYIRFHERAGRIMEALLGSIQPQILTVRFGVGGVTVDLNSEFSLSDRFLEHLWQVERPISYWVRKQHSELMDVAGLGRSYALADAALRIEKISGMSRLQAIDNGCYYAYLRQIYLRAFNLYGIFPLKTDELGVLGVDPWMQVAAGQDFQPNRCTGRQLQLFAKRQFRDYQISFEVFSLLSHLPLLLSVAQRLKPVQWNDVLQNELSARWLSGETGEWIEGAIQVLESHSASVPAQQVQAG